MGIRDLLIGAAQRASVEDPKYPLTSARLVELLGGAPTDSGELVNPKKAMTLISVFRAVQIISGTCAGVPLHGYRREGDDEDNRKKVTSEYPVLYDPHPEMTRFELREWMHGSVELQGNAFMQKIRFTEKNKRREDGTLPIRYLLPIRAELVRVGRSADGTKMFEVRDSETGEVTPATSKEILHIPGFAYDGTVGLSPIDLARQGIGSALAAERYAAMLFGRGALMSGILQTDRRLPPGAADALQERWQAMAGGLAQAHKVAVLDQGAKFQPIQITPEQAQFLETRKFGVIEIARLFGVPPHLLMETSAASNWGTGLVEQTQGFITFSLAYRLIRVEQRFEKELMLDGDFCEHRTEGLLRGDTLKRYQAHAIALKNRFKTRGEVRREENLPVDDPELNEFEELPTPGDGVNEQGTDDSQPGDPKLDDQIG